MTTNNKKLYRSKNSMFAGVCAGLADYFSLDPTLVRVGWALLTILSVGFPGIIIYIVMMLIVPKEV